MKTTILWFVIIFLALRVYGYWLDDQARKNAGKHWASREKNIFEQAEAMACDDLYKDKTFSYAHKTVKSIYLEKVLNLKEDPDFRILTIPERQKFYGDFRWHVLGAWDLCHKDAEARKAVYEKERAENYAHR